MDGKKGILVTFEGGDGSGKSTQARILLNRLKVEGYPAVATFEPGGTPIGLAIRDLLLKSRLPMQPLTEALLFYAARAENVENVIKPALRRGDIVICDRFTDSSLAYQGYGKGISLDKIRRLTEIVANSLKPDMTILLDIEARTSLHRVAEAEGDRIGGHLQLGFDMGDPLDGHKRYGGWEVEVHEKIQQGYRSLAEEDPSRWLVIDATLPSETIAAMVWEGIAPLLQQRQRPEKPQSLFDGQGGNNGYSS